MDVEQLQKQLEFVEDERRKDRAAIADLKKQIESIAGIVPGLAQQIQEQSEQLSRIPAKFSRFQDIDDALVQIRTEHARGFESIDKQRLEHDREAEKGRRSDLEAANRTIGDIRKQLEVLPDLKRNLQTRMEEDYRLGRLIEEVDKKVKETQRSDEEYVRVQKLMEEGRRQDSKRVTDMQGEVSALRKRVDEQRGKVDVTADSQRKLELRLSEFQAIDLERRQVINSFIEKQTLAMVERDRSWKEMQTQFGEISSRASTLDSQLGSLEAVQRAIKRSQDAFDDITLRFDRRINEITEMQRLVEERFQQEWVSFRADDQKRWTNYTLAQDEQQREASRQDEKINERLLELEDITHEIRDQVHLIIEETQKRLQNELAQAHAMVEEYDRSFGHAG